MRGFSLIESIVAVGLLATTLITLAHLISVAVSTDAFARHATMAAILASQKMEAIRDARPLDESPPAIEFLDKDGNVVCAVSLCESAVYIRRSGVSRFGGVPETFLVDVSVRHRALPSREARMVTALGMAGE